MIWIGIFIQPHAVVEKSKETDNQNIRSGAFG